MHECVCVCIYLQSYIYLIVVYRAKFASTFTSFSFCPSLVEAFLYVGSFVLFSFSHFDLSILAVTSPVVIYDLNFTFKSQFPPSALRFTLINSFTLSANLVPPSPFFSFTSISSSFLRSLTFWLQWY